MAAYWMTEAIPMAATALLPVVLMPWLGVLGAKDIYHNYLKVKVLWPYMLYVQIKVNLK